MKAHSFIIMLELHWSYSHRKGSVIVIFEVKTISINTSAIVKEDVRSALQKAQHFLLGNNSLDPAFLEVFEPYSGVWRCVHVFVCITRLTHDLHKMHELLDTHQLFGTHDLHDTIELFDKQI